METKAKIAELERQIEELKKAEKANRVYLEETDVPKEVLDFLMEKDFKRAAPAEYNLYEENTVESKVLLSKRLIDGPDATSKYDSWDLVFDGYRLYLCYDMDQWGDDFFEITDLKSVKSAYNKLIVLDTFTYEKKYTGTLKYPRVVNVELEEVISDAEDEIDTCDEPEVKVIRK